MPNERLPTKQVLIDTVLSLLATSQPHEITIEQVLKASGVSSGSLYHHFGHFSSLIDHALAAKYGEFGDLQIDTLAQAVLTADSYADFAQKVGAVMDHTHSPEMASIRMLRAWIVAQAAGRPEFRKLLSEEQNRITHGLADVVREIQQRGWAKPQFDPLVLSTFIQAYTIGRVVDDVADPGVDNAEWLAFMKYMVVRSMMNPPEEGSST